MEFTHECVLRKNTTEIRERLIMSGRTHRLSFNTFDDDMILCFSNDFITFPSESYYKLIKTSSSAIDCGYNEKLFLAIAAMREDSDYLQWFTIDNNNWILSGVKSFDIKVKTNSNELYYHKATIKELIEHFNKNESKESYDDKIELVKQFCNKDYYKEDVVVDNRIIAITNIDGEKYEIHCFIQLENCKLIMLTDYKDNIKLILESDINLMDIKRKNDIPVINYNENFDIINPETFKEQISNMESWLNFFIKPVNCYF